MDKILDIFFINLNSKYVLKYYFSKNYEKGKYLEFSITQKTDANKYISIHYTTTK